MNQVLEEREVEGREGLRCCCETADDTTVAVARNSRLLAVMHISDQLVTRHLIYYVQNMVVYQIRENVTVRSPPLYFIIKRTSRA